MRPYEPCKLPIDGIDRGALVTPVGEATAALARYDGLLQATVNPAIFLSPLINREATLSSRIEGTQATVEEVLEHEAGHEYDESKTGDIREIQNYRKALSAAGDHVQSYPITLALVRGTHRVLMDTVRGENKRPGEFRRDQNWIGSLNTDIEQATFVPPSPLQLQGHLEAWEAYVQSKDFDPIVQCAVTHAQFEMLHPFSDGNGRVGRMLIPLFLYVQKRLSSPMFYLSEYLETHRDDYYASLMGISSDGNWDDWVVFFLKAVENQAALNIARLQNMRRLYDETKRAVPALTKSPYSAQIVDELFNRPMFTAAQFSERTGIPQQSVYGISRALVEAKILVEVRAASGRRPAILAFSNLLLAAESVSLSTTPA